jgi:hypothetical protein
LRSYETVKTVLFPEMGSIGSHITTTCVVGLITFLTARYVVNQQARLLLERERSNEDCASPSQPPSEGASF